MRHVSLRGGSSDPPTLGGSQNPPLLDRQVRQIWQAPLGWVVEVTAMAATRSNFSRARAILRIVLRALSTMGPQHAYGLAARARAGGRASADAQSGEVYPALVRLEQKGLDQGRLAEHREANREAKYYSITKPGARASEKQNRASGGGSAGLVVKQSVNSKRRGRLSRPAPRGSPRGLECDASCFDWPTCSGAIRADDEVGHGEACAATRGRLSPPRP